MGEIIVTNRGEEFELTKDEEKYLKALRRLEKMKPGRLKLFGNGHLSVRINDAWYDDEFEMLNIFCEGGDGGDNI